MKVYVCDGCDQGFPLSDLWLVTDYGNHECRYCQQCAEMYKGWQALTVIEDKEDYKSRHKKSPDDTDSLIMLSEVAHKRGFRLAAQGQSLKKYESHEKVVEKAQAVFEISYEAGNEDLSQDFEFAGGMDE